MAYDIATLDEFIVPALQHFVLRQTNSTLPGGKTPEKYVTRGRFNYDPSFSAAVIFAVLYLIIVSLNLFQYFWHRSWFWWPMVLAVIMELVGYLTRSASIKSLDSKNFFIIQSILLLVAPAVMAAACYMGFGRIVLWVVPQPYQSARHLWMPARRMTPLFVTSDAIGFFIQCIGGGIIAAASKPSNSTKGKNILLVGLALQLVTFGFFTVASVRFAVVLRGQLKELPLPKNTNWRLSLNAINVCSVLILVRSIYRFVEYALGAHNYLADHEAFFYCFDASLILVVGLTFVVVHPGFYLPYLGLRRKQLVFSRNVGRGPFSKLSLGENPPTTPFGNKGQDIGSARVWN